MKKRIDALFSGKLCLVCFLSVILACFVLSGCGLIEGLLGDGGNNNDALQIEDELTSATGKWILTSDEDTYFVFDGSKGVMTYSYYENAQQKYNGKFRVVYHGMGDVATPLSFIFTRSDKQKEDWIGCYVDDFETDFSQFTVFSEEEDLGMVDASIYTHKYRISELPYVMGTYVLEGKEYKQEKNDYSDADKYVIPSGTYVAESGESFTFLSIKPTHDQLFSYKNGDTIVEGTFTIAQDKKTIYLYIEHDFGMKVTNADKKHYDTTFDIYYPPDFYLRGDFTLKDNSIVINDLYRHGETQTEVQDSVWTFATYSYSK